MTEFSEADLEPERQLQHIRNLQGQVKTLFELHMKLAERVEELEELKEKEESELVTK